MIRPLRIGVAGLGRAFTLMLPTFLADPRVRLVAAADPLPAARAQFTRDFGGPAHAEVAALCDQADVDLVYIATPHQFHAEHAHLAFAAGKHVLVEKPMAISLDECTLMIDAGRRAGRHLIVGHSHSFNRPVARVREMIASRAWGEVRMITALNFTDFLYRPRRPEELATGAGGGVVFSQGAHQVDIVRLLGGGMLDRVRAMTGAWDPARPTEGAYSALLQFACGAFAHATYSGYAHYDSDELVDGIGEMGQSKSPANYGAARRRLATADPAHEATFKASRNYGGAAYAPPPTANAAAWQHFGFLVVSCDRADLRPTAKGVMIYDDRERRFEALPSPRYPREEVIDEIVKGVISTDETEIRSTDVSILFADISGFTTISETKPPEEVAEFLSHFFSCAVEAIFAFGGTLDKFIGDAVMAFFGAPIPQEDHAYRAVNAGLLMRSLVGKWNDERKAQGLDPVLIRVGINSGPAVVGNVGTEKRVDYTVLGTSVNIASRLESGVAKPGQVVISQHTFDKVGGRFKTEALGEFPLKGLKQKLPVYSVVDEAFRRPSIEIPLVRATS